MLDMQPLFQNSGQRVTQWALDADAGQINAFDEHGRLLMVIATNPLFGPRLAAAFGWPVGPAWPATGVTATGPGSQFAR